MPGVFGIVYVDNEYWFNECKKYNLKCYFDFPYPSSILLIRRKAPFGMPFFFGMMEMSMENHPGFPFYGYINGDILVENTIANTLRKINEEIQSGSLGPKVAAFTHRKNMFASFPDDLYSNHQESRECVFLSSSIVASCSTSSIVAASPTGTLPS
jgi:singapore isolate B (sub-type 7) whole genome shotgun sequence assembly, scaffold_7